MTPRRIAVITDFHANLPAPVLRALEERQVPERDLFRQAFMRFEG